MAVGPAAGVLTGGVPSDWNVKKAPLPDTVLPRFVPLAPSSITSVAPLLAARVMVLLVRANVKLPPAPANRLTAECPPTPPLPSNRELSWTVVDTVLLPLT